VYGAVPPDTVRFCAYGTPLVAGGSEHDDVRSNTAGLTVTLQFFVAGVAPSVSALVTCKVKK
jgi:hypothetical protein